MTMTIAKCHAHIPNKLTPEIEKFAIEEVFEHQRYIFTRREGKQQYGYCTYCHKDFPTPGYRHNWEVTCPECGSICFVKASGISRKKMVNEAYFTYYLKSAIDPQAIVAIGLYAVRDFSGSYRGVKTKYIDMNLYVFKPGVGGHAFTRWAYYSQAQTMEAGTLSPAKSVKCKFYLGHNANIHSTYSRESIAAAVAGTPYRYSTWEKYDINDMTEFFDLCSRYPCVEYLTKLGFGNMVESKLLGYRTYSAINWRGQNLLRVLKLTKQELKTIKSQRLPLNFLTLRILQLGKKDGSNLTIDEAIKISNGPGSYYDDLIKLLRYGSIRKISGYLSKQAAKHYNGSASQALITWRDYIADCGQLNLDITQERVLFPRNLYRAHQNTIKQIKIKADKELDKKIKIRAKRLYEQYYFEHQGLMIRPAQSTRELIAEGKALHHCVGTYAKRYAAGDIILLLIRKISEPDKPYFTVEVRNRKLIQVHGLENCDPDKRVKEFVVMYEAEKLQDKKDKLRKPA